MEMDYRMAPAGHDFTAVQLVWIIFGEKNLQALYISFQRKWIAIRTFSADVISTYQIFTNVLNFTQNITKVLHK